jgi:glycerol uptake facilitator-like aquaporin
MSRSSNTPTLGVAAIAEFVATSFLLIAVVGSGITAERLSGGNVALALLANALATAAALFALIVTLGPVSGAHMNPVVSLGALLTGGMAWRALPAYVAAQIAGGAAGVWLAHGMFDLPVLQLSTRARAGAGQGLAEIVATAGLLGVVWGTIKREINVTAAAVAAYFGGAYWFTASTSFANPAVTIARTLTDTFAGIRPADAPGFILAQIAALVLLLPVLRWFTRSAKP